MLETIKIIGALLGGLGLFLLAIGMMTDGLKLAAGSSLKKMLANWTKTPLRGIFSGFIITAIVQSSSAVTVASIGFVNAGLLNMRQTLGIVYGANVGTTMTGWLVALVGFKLNIHAFAFPMIGIGMLVKLLKPGHRAAAFGVALVGFGLFFVGIDILKTAFEGLVETFDISAFTAQGLTGVVVFLLIGIVMTILTQSSSAAIALTITAAASGMIELYAAAAMVIGANIGTTSTAMIAAIGATSQAKRVVGAQVIFNVVTAMVALSILPLLFLTVEALEKAIGLEANPGITLAIFHSVFNVLGVLLVFPFNSRLASFLEKRFLSWEEKESHPKYLDKAIAATPILALNALVLEMQGIATRVSHLCKHAISSGQTAAEFRAKASIIKLLSGEVSNFIVGIERSALTEEITKSLATLLRIEQYFLSCTNSAERIFEPSKPLEKFGVEYLDRDTQKFFGHVIEFIDVGLIAADISDSQIDEQSAALQVEYDQLKANLLLAGTRSQISVHHMSEAIEHMGELKRMAQQWHKAIKRIKQLVVESGAVSQDSSDGNDALGSNDEDRKTSINDVSDKQALTTLS